MSVKKGDKVIIAGSAEELIYKGCVFEVLSEPYMVCGSELVKMKCHETGKYFGGGYATKFLIPFFKYEELAAERDRYKAMAKALEMALRVGATCMTCVHASESETKTPCVNCDGDKNNWQFDEMRFTDLRKGK